MIFTIEQIRKWKDAIAKTPTIENRGTAMFAITRNEMESILDRLEASEEVVQESAVIARSFQRMRNDHYEKLVDHQTFESASQNWDKLLQEPLEFGPLLKALDKWISLYGISDKARE